MSEPIPNTVRGLLQGILAALGGAQAQAEILAEIRFLNTRLFGSDSTGTPTGGSNWQTIWNQTLFVPDGAAGTRPLGNWLNLRMVPANQNLWGQVLATTNAVNALAALLRSGDASETLYALTLRVLTELQSLNQVTFDANVIPGDGAFQLNEIRNLIAQLQSTVITGTAADAVASQAMITLLECICDASGGGGEPGGGIPSWQEVACQDNTLLTATFTFSGTIDATGSVATGLQMSNVAPNFSPADIGTINGPGLQYGNEQISSCYIVVTDSSYNGTIGAQMNPVLIANPALGGGRPTPPQAAPGPEQFTFYGWSSAGQENFIAYNCSVAADPPIDGSLVRVYVGRPDPGA